jgi:hypothetical protein
MNHRDASEPIEVESRTTRTVPDIFQRISTREWESAHRRFRRRSVKRGDSKPAKKSCVHPLHKPRCWREREALRVASWLEYDRSNHSGEFRRAAIET